MPSKHLSIVRKEEVVLLYPILKGYKMNVGKIIGKSILNYYYSNFRCLIPHPSTITTLCIMGRVQFNMEEEERCPKTPPLTLTVITSLGKPSSTTINFDNIGAIYLTSNPIFHVRTKHIKLNFHFVREQVANGNIQVHFVSSPMQLADL